MNKEQLSARVQAVYDATDFDDPNGNFSSYYYAGYIGADGWMEIVYQLVEAGVLIPVGLTKTRPITLSLMDAAIVINLIRQYGNHPEHTRIADDMQEQMLNGTNGASEGSDRTTR